MNCPIKIGNDLKGCIKILKIVIIVKAVYKSILFPSPKYIVKHIDYSAKGKNAKVPRFVMTQ